MRMSLTAILSLAVILLVQLAAEEFRVDGKTTKKPKPAAIPLRAKREATTTTSSPAPSSSSSTTAEATKQDDDAEEAEVDSEAEAISNAANEMGELLVEIFKELTTNDTDEAEFVDSEVKTSFPWMADVDLASREAVTKAIRERFTRRVDADLRSEGEIFADQLIAGIGMLAMERLFPHPKEGRVFGEMMIHLFKWLNQEESN